MLENNENKNLHGNEWYKTIKIYSLKNLTNSLFVKKLSDLYLNMSALLVNLPCINSGARYLGSPSRAWVVSHW